MPQDCAICQLHGDGPQTEKYEISRNELWVLRHHPDPAPLLGWLVLDTVRHCPGALAFSKEEAANWGPVVRDASALVKRLTQCDRIYSIAFGEFAQHLHMHLIPRFASAPATTAWAIADHYRAVASAQLPGADPQAVAELMQRARSLSLDRAASLDA